jgi:hypothetical protein
VFIQPGDVAGAHPVDAHEHSDGSITDEEDEDQEHDGHAYDEDEEAALLEDELHMMEQELNGQPQEVRPGVALKRDHGVGGC